MLEGLAEMGRRVLSISIETFDDPTYSRLPFSDLSRRLVTALTEDPHHYRPVEPPKSLDAEAVGAAVKQVVRASVDDVVIVHVVSHGERWADDVRVVGVDGKAVPESSVRFWLEHAYGDRLPVETDPDLGEAGHGGPWVLFLLDMCGAGLAVRQPWQASIADEFRRVWTIAATGVDQSAFNARFTRAAAEVLADLRSLDVAPTLRYVPLGVFQKALHRRVQELGGGIGNYQRVTMERIDDPVPLDPPPFLVNPQYSGRAGFVGPPELRAYVETLNELIDPWHFVTRAVGVTPTELGRGFFHGRAGELRELTTWLTRADGSDGETVMLVTGSPGAGKSALLGMLVCAAHPDLRDATWHIWRHRAVDLPQKAVTDLVAVHARERATDEVIGLIGRQVDPTTRVSAVDKLISILEAQSQPPTIVVDAVDEAANPAGLVAALDTLARHIPPVCRLLIGARTGPLWPATIGLLDLVGPAGVVDLDQIDRSALRHDLAGYAADLLALDNRYAGHDHAEVRRVLATGIGQRLADPPPGQRGPGWGEFLLTGLFVQHLRRRETVRNAKAAEALAAQSPVTVPSIIDTDLDPDTDTLARAVLTTLAYSFGDGMPRTMLRDCVPVFAEAPVAALDIDDALDRISFYLRRGTNEHGVSTYRPFHHAITEHLGDPLNRPPTTNARLRHADMLKHMLAQSRPHLTAPPQWSGADPYVLRHAIDHAGRGSGVDDLLTDPEFLVHAEPGTLRHHLHLATAARARANAVVYRTTLAIQTPELARRRGLLQLDATRHGHTDLAAALSQARTSAVVTPRWATLTQHSPALRHTLIGHTGEVNALAIAVMPDGTPVAVTAGQDRTARVWDLTTGQHRHTLRGHTSSLHSVATGVLPDGTPVAVTRTWGRTTLLVWDLTTGRTCHAPPGDIESIERVATSAKEVAVVLPDGTRVAVTAGRDGTARVSDPTTGRTLHTLAGHAEAVVAVAVVALPDGTPVAVTASHDGTARVWDLTYDHTRRTLSGHRDVVAAAATAVLPDGTPVAVTAGHDGTARVWHLGTGQTRHTFAGHAKAVVAVAVVALPDGTPVAVTASHDGTAQMWDLTTGQAHGRPAWLTSPAWALAGAVLPDGTPVAVTAGHDGTVGVLDLTTGRTLNILTGHTGPVVGVATAVLPDGTPVAVTGSWDATVRIWDLAIGQVRHTLAGHAATVWGVATAVLPHGAPIALSTSQDGTVRMWDLVTGQTRYTLSSHANVRAVATTVVADGAPVALTTGDDRTVRLWDLGSGRQLWAQPTPYPIRAVSALGGYVVIGFGREVACFEIEKGRRL